MKVKEIKEAVNNSPFPTQRIVIENDWTIFIDTSEYDSAVCDEDEVDYIYIDESSTLHIQIGRNVKTL